MLMGRDVDLGRELAVKVLLERHRDDPDAVRRFVEGKDWPMTILIEPASRLPVVFTSDGIPATYLIAPDGRVEASAIGSAGWDDSSVVEFLKRMDSRRPKAEPPGEPETDTAPNTDLVYCHRCGASMPKAYGICPGCGNPLGN